MGHPRPTSRSFRCSVGCVIIGERDTGSAQTICSTSRPNRSAASPDLPADRGRRRRWRRPRAGRAVRRGHSGHDRAVRGDRIARHHRRGAAEVSQLLDILRPRAAEHRAGRIQDPVLGWPRPPHAAVDRRAVPLPDVCRPIPRCGAQVCAQTGETGGDLALRLEPDVPSRARSPVTRGSSLSMICCESTRQRSATACERARTSPGRLHGRAARRQARSFRRTAAPVHRPE